MKQVIPREVLVQISDCLYEIPKTFRADMRVPARIYVNEHMLERTLADSSLWQIVNVATLPGIQKYALAMADMHEGYGFPIGGVAGMAIDEDGVISPGGIGYDINCGVRLLASGLQLQDVKPQIRELAQRIYHAVPSGTGRGGPIALSAKQLDRILEHGAKEAVRMGFGTASDLETCEESGGFEDCDASKVSERAKDRGRDQLGTLGSGNHFLEVQVVEEVFDEKVAQVFGLHEGQITVMIHCGSRGLGHQVCTDYVAIMLAKQNEWGYHLPDRQLACAPFNSPEGQDYFSAMKCSANFAFANRHTIAHNMRAAWQKVFGEDENLRTVSDVCHNIGKREVHKIDGKKKELIVHRKGATRAFGPGCKEIPAQYQSVGQPVLIPGTMGTASYVLVGTKEGMEAAFGSSCHGAGRSMSRMAAKKMIRGSKLREELEDMGIIVCSDSDRGLAEEASIAYKDVDEVVGVVHRANLAHKVARLRPLAVVKGD